MAGTEIARLIIDHLSPFSLYIMDLLGFLEKITASLNMEMLISIILGSIFLYATTLVRYRAEEL